MSQLLLKQVNQKLDQLLSNPLNRWVNEKEFSARTGLDTRFKLYHYRRANPTLVRKAPGGFIYDIQGWFELSTPIAS